MRPHAVVKQGHAENLDAGCAQLHDAGVGLEAGLKEMDRAAEVIRDRRSLEAYSVDEGDAAPQLPEAVVFPTCTQEVAGILQAANKHLIPVTPRGAGTNRVGGSVPCAGGVVLSMDRFQRTLDIDEDSSRAHVRPNLITQDLHQGAEACALFYGPDPSSSSECQIGGNIASNAAGPRAFKYGPTAHWVLGLEVVCANGEVLQLGAGTSKSVSGYNLKSLVTGSEGTLAVICGATLRLVPASPEVAAMLITLRDEHSLTPTIRSLARAQVRPRCIEFLDYEALQVLRRAESHEVESPFPQAAHAALLVEVEGEDVLRSVERAANRALTAGALDVRGAYSPEEQARLWLPRRRLSRLLRTLAAHKLSEDVVVPRAQLPALLTRVRETAGRLRLRNATYGHAGDGNLHVNFFWDDDDEKRRVDAGVRKLFEDVVELGGSLSGEHGIGLSKAPFLGLELSPRQVELQRRIKQTFDPKNILNPGKIFASRGHGLC